jgi:predicted phage terminase large subunit-like protein
MLLTPQQAAQELLARRAAKTNFLDFARYMMPDDQQPQEHHKLIADALDKVERGEITRLMILLPPGSAKSTYGSGLFPSYFLGKNPRSSVIAGTHTTEFSARWGRRVRNMVAEEKFQKVFPVGVASDSAAAGHWSTTEGGEYFAVGAGARVQGRRADLMVIDDPLGSREDADSETIRSKLHQWYDFDLSPRLKPGGRVVLINTRYHEMDLSGYLLAKEPEKWHVIKVRMEAVEGETDPLGRQPGQRLWPDWFTQDMVDAAKADPRTWTSLYQQSPAPIGGGELKKSWVQFYDQANFFQMNKVMLVDPAGGRKDKKSDYTAIWVLALGEDENLYVCDMVRDRLDLAERTETIFRLHRKWKPLQTRIERYGLMSDTEHIRYEQNRRNYRFSITEVGGATKKEDRIRRLVPYFRAGRVWFPREYLYTDHTGKTKDLVHSFIEEELSVFPVGAYDDMLDSLARIAEPTLDLPWPRKSDFGAFPVIDFGVMDPVVGY